MENKIDKELDGENCIGGLFLFNKPSGVSSAGFLNSIKFSLAKITNNKSLKIGHGGTLDPFASGLLVVGVSREYTKTLLNILKDTNKLYRTEIILGATSDTFDKMGKIKNSEKNINLTKDDVVLTIEKIKKSGEQSPPSYSAIKINGKKSYELAREKGIMTQHLPKSVSIFNYKINSFKKDIDIRYLLDITIEVSSGFYVRSFANDIGKELGVGGYCQELSRLKIGEYDLEEALSIDDLMINNLELYLPIKIEKDVLKWAQNTLKIARKWFIRGVLEVNGSNSAVCILQSKIEILSDFLDEVKNQKDVEVGRGYFRKTKEVFDGLSIID